MPHFEMAECPVCEKTAYGRNGIEEEFGYCYGSTTPQSWCKSAEVWAVDADTRIVHIGVKTILDAIIR